MLENLFSDMNETYNMDSLNEQQLGKEYELQAQNPLTTMQLERINTHLQNRHC